MKKIFLILFSLTSFVPTPARSGGLFTTGFWQSSNDCLAGSQSFSAGGSYAFTLPVGCTTFTVKLWGAGGGGGSTYDGSSGVGGGFVTATLSGVSSGSAFTVLVGGGGGGGGRSALRYGAKDILTAGSGSSYTGGGSFTVVSASTTSGSGSTPGGGRLQVGLAALEQGVVQELG